MNLLKCFPLCTTSLLPYLSVQKTKPSSSLLVAEQRRALRRHFKRDILQQKAFLCFRVVDYTYMAFSISSIQGLGGYDLKLHLSCDLTEELWENILWGHLEIFSNRRRSCASAVLITDMAASTSSIEGLGGCDLKFNCCISR
ncbi:uncharacterized protein LOC111367540 [Olea europaea var. sylvestris]|uniref:uncharacterized protein LOC111367540 n=1 Tax=Olea europaea var. sylvestris TaxID=158386 RepID=UPI000C1D3228|nr:uncharacterized protein LOC111367540 [Olea europaea var. sylvestris]